MTAPKNGHLWNGQSDRKREEKRDEKPDFRVRPLKMVQTGRKSKTEAEKATVFNFVN